MLLKPNTLLYIRRNSLIIAGKHITPARLTVPTTVIQNLEVRNAAEYIELCRAFFEEHGIHGKRILAVLDDSTVFSKTIELTKAGNPEKLLASFTAAMPFAPGQRSCIGVSTDNELRAYATNADLCDVLAEAVKVSGAGKLIAITPAAAYGLSADQQLSTAVDIFLADSAVRGHANFLSVKPQ